MTPDQIPPPHQVGLTPEAAEALGIASLDGISLEADVIPDLVESDYLQFEGQFAPTESAGDIVDAELIDDSPKPAERAKLNGTARTTRTRGNTDDTGPREAKSGPPSLDEWQRFFSRVLLKVITETYINWVFRGIDEDTISERDIERLMMTDDERKYIAVPLAEVSNKSKFMRKHGRMIVASGDAFNAFVVMTAWANRVNRIAAKYKPQSAKISEMRIRSERNGSPTPSGNEAQPNLNGTLGGRFPEGFNGTVYNGGSG